MQIVSIILLVCLAATTFALMAFWAIALHQIVRMVQEVPTARAGLELARRRIATPRVCVVVPAHNEQAIIADHLRSLRAQDYPAMRVVLALDRCTDDTAVAAREEIGGDERFTILEIDRCPPDWAGKVHAIWTAVNSAAPATEAEILLFADADTNFIPQCVSAAVALMRERDLALLSLVSTLTGTRWYERLVQPAAGVELMRQYPLIRANRDKRRRAFANGQFMMFRAEAYRAVGGHESVKHELLEDLALARLMEGHGLRAGVFLADGVMTCRMYRDWAAFRRGWKRIYTEAANRRARRLARSAHGVRLTGTILPLCALALVVAALVWVPDDLPLWRYGLAGLACAALGTFLAAVGWAYRVSRAPVWAVPGYVIGAWLVGSLLAEAGRDLRRGTPTTWGGRSYVRENR